MKKLFKMMKPGDVVILAFLVFLSFLPVIIFSYNNITNHVDSYTAVVSADGEVIKEFELKDDGEREVYDFADEHGHTNTIVREGTEIYMTEANCPDQLCVRKGSIDEVGETIVCLPNKLLVEVTSDNPDVENDIDVIS